MFARSEMTLRKWYHSSVAVPDFHSPSYQAFVTGSMGIVRSILKERLHTPVRVLFRSVPTAHADPDQGEIVINERWLKGQLGGTYGSLRADDTIALLMGVIVHEAAHFAYSPKDLKPWGLHIRKYTKLSYVEQIAHTLGNVIEDIYIEAEVDRQVPTLSWTLDCVNRVFFARHSLAAALSAVESITAAPATNEDIAKVLSVLIYAKTQPAVATNPFVADLFALVRTATEIGRIEDRFALALTVYERLMANYGKATEPLPIHDDDGAKSEAGESEGGSGASGDESGASEFGPESESGAAKSEPAEKTIPTGDLRPLDEVKKMAEGLSATPLKDKGAIGARPSTTEGWRIEVALERMEDTKVTLEDGGDVGSEAGLVFMERVPRLGDAVEADQRYDRLVEIGRQRAVANRPYGLDRNRGTNIRKLHRIATDQKIFAEPVQMTTYKPMQVILLIDCSGSMVGSRIEAATKAALGAARALVEAHCEVAVYGHTACTVMDNDVLIYKIKTFTEPVTVMPTRLGSLACGREHLAENKDGYAIGYVAKKFTSQTKRRFLIVLSDGTPQAPGYRGPSADRHTKRAVDAVREMKIDVLSISITEAARTGNDYIYGKEHNVFNHDPNVIEGIVKSLLLQ